MTRAEDTACVKGLVAADCDLLEAATANVGKLITFELGYDLNVSFTGAPVGDINFNIKGRGPFDLTKVTNSDARTVFDNLNMSSAAELTATGQAGKVISKAEVRVIDGSVYFFVDAAGGENRWYKIIVSKVIESASDNPDLAAFNTILLPQSLIGLAGSYDNATGIRKPGPSLDGKATRLYSLNYEGGVLLDALPEAQQQQLMTQVVTLLIRNLPLEQQAKLKNNAAFNRAFERVVRGARIAVGWLVEPSGKMIRGFSAEVHIKVDAAIGKLLAREFATGITYFDITLMVTYSKLGTHGKVEVPKDAFDLTDMIQLPSKSA